MGIREHRKKQRAEKALFLAGLLAKQSTATKARIAVTDTNPNTSAVQSTDVSTTSSMDLPDLPQINTSVPKLTELCARNVVTNSEPCGPLLQCQVPELTHTQQEQNIIRNGVTKTNVNLEETCIENTTDLNTILTNSPEEDTTQQDADLDITLDYMNDPDTPSGSPVPAKGTGSSNCESDSMELVVNKNNIKTYTRMKTTRPTQEQPPLPNVTDSMDIDMIEDTRNVELIDLSENLAKSLVITDLEELMNEHFQPEFNVETNIPDRPMSPKGTFSYSFLGIRRKQSTPKTAGTGKYQCLACPSNWDTRGAMCEHYRVSHPPSLVMNAL